MAISCPTDSTFGKGLHVHDVSQSDTGNRKVCTVLKMRRPPPCFAKSLYNAHEVARPQLKQNKSRCSGNVFQHV